MVVTKGDIISQAEREIFRERVLEMNPRCKVLEVNALSGQGCAELAEEMIVADAMCSDGEELRHSAPLAVCTLCAGETRISREYHRGILRRVDGVQHYIGE